MITKTINGLQITVDINTTTIDKTVDGIKYGEEDVTRTTIKLIKGGNVIAEGSELIDLRPSMYQDHAELAKKGAVAMLGRQPVGKPTADAIKAALIETGEIEQDDTDEILQKIKAHRIDETKAAQYDRTNNESSEGFNPYRHR